MFEPSGRHTVKSIPSLFGVAISCLLEVKMRINTGKFRSESWGQQGGQRAKSRSQ